MATFLGRQTVIGVGRETTRGTAVAPSHWVRWNDLDFKPMAETVLNDSAMGLVEKNNDSAVTKKWGEGTLGGKVTNEAFGMILYGALGACNTLANGDASGIVYDHTFTVQQSNSPTTLTIAREDGVDDEDFARATVSSLELTMEAGDYLRFSSTFMSELGVVGTNTAAFVEENEYIMPDAVVKMANDVSGIAGASAIAVETLSLTLERSAEPYFAAGDIGVTDIHIGAVEVTGEIELRYEDATYKDLAITNDTKQAVNIEITSSDTIGTAANPSMVIELPKCNLEWSPTISIDEVVKQTVSFTAHYDIAETKMIDVVLTNLTTSY